MATVAIIFRKEKKNKKGQAPIHLRITKNRNVHYLSTSLMIFENEWDEKNKRIKSIHKNSGRLNAFISKKFAEAQNKVLEEEGKSRFLTSKLLRDKVFGKEPSSFLEFADDVIAIYEKEGKIGTYNKNQSIIKKLRAYSTPKNLTFYDITPEFLKNYEGNLRKDLKNKSNTIHKDLKFIRKVFNDAIRQDIIEYEATPFRKYQLKTEKTQRHHLTEEELLLIENCTLPVRSKLDLYRDLFVFAAYAGGLRISDVLKLQRKDFDGSHLNIIVKKTGTQMSFKVPNKALKIIEKYNQIEGTSETFLFPVFKSSIRLTDPVCLDSSISNATAQINKNLKKIATLVKIEKNLSFHVSRHSFAVRALKKGISIDKLSKLMGHAAIRETQVYAKIANTDLDQAMDVFN